MGKILLNTKTGSFAYLLHKTGENRYEIVTEGGSWVTKESLSGFEELAETDISIPKDCPEEGFDKLIIRQAVKRISQAKALFSPISGGY